VTGTQPTASVVDTSSDVKKVTSVTQTAAAATQTAQSATVAAQQTAQASQQVANVLQANQATQIAQNQALIMEISQMRKEFPRAVRDAVQQVVA
jgi:hypothetical protein